MTDHWRSLEPRWWRGAAQSFRLPLVLIVAATMAWSCTSGAPDSAAPTFDVMEKTIAELAAAMDSGEVTSRELVDLYLARIDAYDQRGPALNAMIALNPNARAVAAALDAERATRGTRGALHGVPVIVKDNYDTADMPTTAGVIALATSIPPDDAFQVRKLREAGAVILGEHARAGPRNYDGQLVRRTDTEPVRSRAQPRRVERRHRRGGGGELRRRRDGE